jgi:hypothetical protein
MTAWHIVVFEGLIVAYLTDHNSCCRPQSVQIFGFLLILLTAVRKLPPYFILTFSCPKWPILWIFSYQNYL